MGKSVLKKGLWEVADGLKPGETSRVVSLSSNADGTRHWVCQYGVSGELVLARGYDERKHGALVEEKKLENGGVVGEPIPPPIAFYLIQVEEKQAARIRALDEVRDSIRETLEQQQKQAMEKQWRDQLRGRAVIFRNPNKPADLEERQAEPPAKAPASTLIQSSSASPKHFWFDYNFEPSPGKRKWTMVDKDTWTEEYGSGTVSRFKIVGHEVVQGASGTLVVKISGGPQQTLTSNDGEFQVFIPDVGNNPMRLWCRNKINGDWEQWKWLNDMQGVE